MMMLEAVDLSAVEWGDDKIFILQISGPALAKYREKSPEHVVSVEPGDWVVCGFGGLIYGREELVKHLSPPCECASARYITEFENLNNLLLRLNRAAA